MPQLDVATYPSQLFWLVICFALLYLLLSRSALPRIAAALEERRDKIADELDQAAQMKRQSEEVLSEYEAMFARSREQAQAMAQEARDKLHKEAEAQRQQLTADLRDKVILAEEQLDESRSRARDKLQLAATELAELMLRHLSATSVSRERLEESVSTLLQAQQPE